MAQIGRKFVLYSRDYEGFESKSEVRLIRKAHAKNGSEAYLVKFSVPLDLTGYGFSESSDELIIAVRHRGCSFDDATAAESIFVNIFCVRRGLLGRRLLVAKKSNFIAVGEAILPQVSD